MLSIWFALAPAPVMRMPLPPLAAMTLPRPGSPTELLGLDRSIPSPPLGISVNPSSPIPLTWMIVLALVASALTPSSALLTIVTPPTAWVPMVVPDAPLMRRMPLPPLPRFAPNDWSLPILLDWIVRKSAPSTSIPSPPNRSMAMPPIELLTKLVLPVAVKRSPSVEAPAPEPLSSTPVAKRETGVEIAGRALRTLTVPKREKETLSVTAAPFALASVIASRSVQSPVGTLEQPVAVVVSASESTVKLAAPAADVRESRPSSAPTPAVASARPARPWPMRPLERVGSRRSSPYRPGAGPLRRASAS